ncbi:MAG: hypothetical protein ABSH28_05110 [Acidobacteriota bacterium]
MLPRPSTRRTWAPKSETPVPIHEFNWSTISTEKIGVEGMSDGTCDQLYLALRLASLENHLEAHEPVPFVIADILINFDDSRAEATLKVLAELPEKRR